MRARQISLTTYDMERLESLMQKMESSRNRTKECSEQLNKELEQANILDPQDIPKNVVTMNSVMRIKDLESGEEVTYTLAFPSDASIERQRISIFSAIGTALIGRSVGDIVEWKVPSGPKRLEIKEILYQPEASGHFKR